MQCKFKGSIKKIKIHQNKKIKNKLLRLNGKCFVVLFATRTANKPERSVFTQWPSEPSKEQSSSVSVCFFEIPPLLQRACGDRLLPISPGRCAESQSSRRGTGVKAEAAARGPWLLVQNSEDSSSPPLARFTLRWWFDALIPTNQHFRPLYGKLLHLDADLKVDVNEKFKLF